MQQWFELSNSTQVTDSRLQPRAAYLVVSILALLNTVKSHFKLLILVI